MTARKLSHSLLALCLIVLTAVSCGRKDDCVQTIETVADLGGHTVAVLMGTAQDIAITEQYPDIELLRLNTPTDVFEALETGNAEFAVIDTMFSIGASLPSRGIHYITRTDITKSEGGMAFAKSDKVLCRQFNAMLQRLTADGTLDKIYARWISGDPEQMQLPPMQLPTKGEPIIVGTMTSYPFNYVDKGMWIGYEMELLYLFACEIGRPVKILNFDFSGLIAALQCGKIDVMVATAMITPERQKVIQFSDPYFHTNTSIFGRAPNAEAASANAGSHTLRQRLYDNIVADNRWHMLLDGLCETLVIVFFTLIFGTAAGALVCWMRMSRRRWLAATARVYIEVMRNLPVLVLLMLTFYVVFASSSISATTVAVVAFSLNFAAFCSEIFRTSIEGVDRGQTEAALALGFGRAKAFGTIVVPQAVRTALPVYKGEVISLVKNTSVVGYIAIQDLTKVSDIIRSRTFDAFVPLLVVTLAYIVIAFVIGRLLERLCR